MTRPLIKNLKDKGHPIESLTADVFQVRAFAQHSLSTIRGPGGHAFNVQGHQITLTCHHTSDQAHIDRAFHPDDQVPALCHEQKALGALLVCDSLTCSLFNVDGESLQPGKKYYHFLFSKNKQKLLVSVSLQIQPVTRPTEADFTRNVRVEAAIAVFNSRMEAAQHELAKEFKHIVETEIRNALK